MFLLDLPTELIVLVLCGLTPIDIIRMQQV